MSVDYAQSYIMEEKSRTGFWYLHWHSTNWFVANVQDNNMATRGHFVTLYLMMLCSVQYSTLWNCGGLHCGESMVAKSIYTDLEIIRPSLHSRIIHTEMLKSWKVFPCHRLIVCVTLCCRTQGHWKNLFIKPLIFLAIWKLCDVNLPMSFKI